MHSLNSKNPLVSVLMTAPRYDPYFQEAIESIVNQIYQPIEVVLVLESDFEAYESILAAVCNNNKGVSYLIERSKVRSFCYCINRAIELCSGELVARMDTDDVSHQERFKMQVDHLLNNPNCTVVGTKAVPIGPDSKRLGDKSLPFHCTDKEIKSVLPYRNPIFHSSIMARKSAILELGSYKYDFHAQDHEMWIRYSFIQGVQFFNLDSELYYYRRHDAQCTSLANAYSGFADIAGFMLRFFLKTGNPKFILGMVVVHPYVRKARSLFKGFA
jgi:glycosyltransferase involved in cell wall biosynthesis